MTALAAVPFAPPEPEARWVLCRCGGRGLALPLAGVREITTPLPATRVPGCGEEVYGLIGLRGRVVTVFDLGAAFARRASALRPDHRLLLLEWDGRVIGAAVDEVLTVADAHAEPGPFEGLHALPGLAPDDLIGTCAVGGERYLAVATERVLERLLS